MTRLRVTQASNSPPGLPTWVHAGWSAASWLDQDRLGVRRSQLFCGRYARLDNSWFTNTGSSDILADRLVPLTRLLPKAAVASRPGIPAGGVSQVWRPGRRGMRDWVVACWRTQARFSPSSVQDPVMLVSSATRSSGEIQRCYTDFRPMHSNARHWQQDT